MATATPSPDRSGGGVELFGGAADGMRVPATGNPKHIKVPSLIGSFRWLYYTWMDRDQKYRYNKEKTEWENGGKDKEYPKMETDEE